MNTLNAWLLSNNGWEHLKVLTCCLWRCFFIAMNSPLDFIACGHRVSNVFLFPPYSVFCFALLSTCLWCQGVLCIFADLCCHSFSDILLWSSLLMHQHLLPIFLASLFCHYFFFTHTDCPWPHHISWLLLITWWGSKADGYRWSEDKWGFKACPYQHTQFPLVSSSPVTSKCLWWMDGMSHWMTVLASSRWWMKAALSALYSATLKCSLKSVISGQQCFCNKKIE